MEAIGQPVDMENILVFIGFYTQVVQDIPWTVIEIPFLLYYSSAAILTFHTLRNKKKLQRRSIFSHFKVNKPLNLHWKMLGFFGDKIPMAKLLFPSKVMAPKTSPFPLPTFDQHSNFGKKNVSEDHRF